MGTHGNAWSESRAVAFLLKVVRPLGEAVRARSASRVEVGGSGGILPRENFKNQDSNGAF